MTRGAERTAGHRGDAAATGSHTRSERRLSGTLSLWARSTSERCGCSALRFALCVTCWAGRPPAALSMLTLRAVLSAVCGAVLRLRSSLHGSPLAVPLLPPRSIGDRSCAPRIQPPRPLGSERTEHGKPFT